MITKEQIADALPLNSLIERVLLIPDQDGSYRNIKVFYYTEEFSRLCTLCIPIRGFHLGADNQF